MYHSHPVKLDITGTIETISHIDKDILYKCYDTFYNPSNMCMVVCGDFDPYEILEEIKKRLVDKKAKSEIKRIYENEEETIVKEEIIAKMDVSIPLFTLGIKCKPKTKSERVKNHICIDILLNMIIGESSKLYQDLYKDGIILNMPYFEYDFTDEYAHILINGISRNPKEFYSRFKNELGRIKKEGLNINDFERIKKMTYGEYVKGYNDVQDIARMFLSDFMKEINSFDYIEEIESVDCNYAKHVLGREFDEEKMVFSVVKKD